MDQGYAKRQRYQGGRGGYGDRSYGGGRDFRGGHGQDWAGRRGGSSAIRWGDDLRPTELKVRTNYFEVKNQNLCDLMKTKYIQYRVTITNAARRRKVDEEGNAIEPFEYEVQPRRALDLKGPAPIKRRILQSLQDRLARDNVFVVFDFDSIAFSTSQIFQTSGKDDEVVDGEVESGKAMEQYGPGADAETRNRESSRLFHDYKVRALATCDETDTFKSDRYGWYIVRLQEIQKLDENSQGQELETMMDIVLKNKFVAAKMKIDGKSLRKFYIPDDVTNCTRNLIGHQIFQAFGRRGKVSAPLIGVSNTVRICQGGRMFVTIDSVLDVFDIDHTCNRNGERQPIPILDTTSRPRTIAGIDVENYIRNQQKITDKNIQHEILEALKKISFHMRYEKKVDEKALNSFREKLQEEGKSEEAITSKVAEWRFRKSKMEMLNKWLKKDVENPVIWSANDHTFEYKRDGEAKTVSIPEYYEEQYGIKIKYPCMPVVFIKDGRREGYFPIEFIFQAFGKVRGGDFKQEILRFNDDKASTQKLQLLCDIKKAVDTRCKDESPSYIAELLEQYHLGEIEEKPLELQATVLRQPTIKFGARTEPKSPSDGSWDLRNIKFANPGLLSSFGVLDFDFGNRDYTSVDAICRKLREHGVTMSNYVGKTELEQVTVNVPSENCGDIYQKFKETLQKTKEYFLKNRRSGALSGCFFTSVLHPERGMLMDAWVVCCGNQFSAVLSEKNCAPTHVVTLPTDTEYIGHKARIKVIIEDQPVDLFDLRCSSEGGLEKRDADNHWRRIHLNGRPRFVYYVLHHGIKTAENVTVVRPCNIVTEDMIECPSIILVRVKTKVPGNVYNFIKFLGNNIFGVQTQVYAQDKCTNGKEQYLSNIALKINTKLFSKTNAARAWDVEVGSVDNTWLKEVPTMVVGLSLARAGGIDQNTVIAASVCLESGSGMQMGQTARVQKKVGVVEKKIMKCTIKSLIKQYYLHHDKRLPSRIIVYRNGTSEGHFNEIMENEVKTIQEAFSDLQRDLRGLCSALSMPTITYVVAVSQHNIRMVPAETKRTRRNKVQNVPSGTCLDHTITNYQDEAGRAIPEEEGVAIDLKGFNGFDFLLTSQGGLKGTSKPIFYRTIFNGNFISSALPSGATPLSREKLEQMTYDMAYSYGTATKAVRMVPVVKYSARLANQIVSSLGYLISNDIPAEYQLREYSSDVDSLFGYDKFRDIADESVKSELLCAYSPLYDASTKNFLRTPFHPHMAA
mmetsp:Transcript_15832/g.24306  ORF Transcript_15832/g.24306 Transcript_15832/m.24306 type:complete len:1247 (-) Transcript_15832:149-3889(-)